MGGEISQSIGSFGFLRTYARVDSGDILNGTTRLFASGSWATPTNGVVMARAPMGPMILPSASIHTLLKRSTSRPWSLIRRSTKTPMPAIRQASNLGAYRFFDFLPRSSGVPTQAVNYYGYNRQSFENWTALSEINYRFDNVTSLTLKQQYDE